MKNRILKILKRIKPLPKEKYPCIVPKIFDVLCEMAKDADFIHVDIYELEKVPGVETNHKCPLCRDPLPHDDAAQLVPRENDRSCAVYRRSYYTEIELKPCTPSPSSVLEIRLNHYNSDQQGWLLPGGEVSRKPIDSGKIYLKTERQLLTIPSGCELQPTMITQVLTSMSVPRHEQPPIVAKIFETIATKNPDGGAFVNVDIYQEALELYNYRAFYRSRLNIGHIAADHPITNEIDARFARELAAEELFAKYKFKPATKSAIEGLERVRADKSCGVCNDNFEEGLVATRLPCLHIFHAHCVLSRLETDHKCPLCRYPLLCAEPALSQDKLDSRLKFKGD